MSSKRDAYNNYLKQFEGQETPVRLTGLTGMLLQGATLISRRGGKIEGSMRFDDAVYQLADGRIAELYRSGNVSLLFAWSNMEAYNNYRTPMSFNVYHE
jgi:hypothetical protein